MKAAAAGSMSVAGQAPPTRTARWLLNALIVIQFFPIPPLPGLGFAPENLIFLATGLYMMRRFTVMLANDRRVMLLTALFLAYALLRTFHNLVHSVSPVLPFEHLRIVIFILALAHVGANDVSLRQLIKLLLIIAAVQIVFGLLVYLFGPPFTGIRNWMLRVNVNQAFISKGSQLAGLYGPPHIFSYLLAAVPVLSVTMFFLERRSVGARRDPGGGAGGQPRRNPRVEGFDGAGTWSARRMGMVPMRSRPSPPANSAAWTRRARS